MWIACGSHQILVQPNELAQEKVTFKGTLPYVDAACIVYVAVIHVSKCGEKVNNNNKLLRRENNKPS